MSTDDVTVSLSRLALAKAIKTPDAGEDEAEPWSKSIIFHQAHIDPQMRYSIEHPQQQQQQQQKQQQQQQQQQQNRRRSPHKNVPHGKQNHVYPQQQQQQQQETKRLVTPPMHRTRSDEMHRHIQPTAERLSSHSASSSSAGRSSLSSTKLTNSKPTRRFVPSDDEEEDDNEESEEEEEEGEEDEKRDEEEKKIVKEKSEDNKMTLKSNHEIVVPIETKKNKGKAPSRLPQPSDDEEEEDEDNSSDSSDDDQDALSSSKGEQLYGRRMSTLRQLERGSSAHRRARSLGDMNHMIIPSPPVETETLNVQPPPQEIGTIEEWRKTVMEEAEGTTSATPVSNPSSLPDESGGQTIEEPAVSMAPNTQGIKAQNRRSMLSDMDMYYYQQQQQQQQMAFQNMQMQQAMQLQQAQQMAQIQQYQQMMQMQQLQQQQLMPTNYNDTRKNRKSMSAMDLMIQLEEEKAASRKTNKKKPLDPSKATLDEGLLSTVPQQGLHNISFQGQSKASKKAIQRVSKSDYNIQGSNNRPPSSAMYSRSSTPMDSRMRSQMIRSESSPIPSVNMSTPMGQYLAPPQMVMQQQQQLGVPQKMTPSRSTGRLSYQSNNNRLSGNWGGYN